MWNSLSSSVSSLAGYGTQSPKPGDVPNAGEGVKSAASLCKDGNYFSELTTKDLEWTISPNASTETQTFYCINDQGHFGHVQLIHSNLGIWGTPISVQITARFRGDGVNKFISTNLTNFTLSADKLSASTNLMSITLSPDGQKFTVQVTNPPDLIVSLTFERTTKGYKIGEGKSYFGDGYVSHKFWPAAKVSGMMIVDGQAHDMAGQGTFVHAIQGMRPHLVASKWSYVDFAGKDAETNHQAKLSLVQFTTPEYYGSTTVAQGSVVFDGDLIGVAVDNKTEFVKTEFDEETGYNPPTDVNYIWEGKTIEGGKSFKAVLNVKPKGLCQKVDLLAEVPWALRKIVSTFVAKPIIYQWYDKATAVITIEGEEHQVSGNVYHEATFVLKPQIMTHSSTANHLPQSVSRLCGELQRLSSEIVETRNAGIAAAATKAISQDSMDVDLDETKPVTDPALQKLLTDAIRSGSRLLSSLKTINRDVHQHERNLRNDLTDQKLSVGKVDLGLQNINYQRKYLSNEIARCHDMETIYQDVPLVSLEEFRETAPEHLINAATDEHQLMLSRLQFELEERKRYDAEKRRLLAVKVLLTKANKARKAQINKAEKQLEAYIQSSQSLQSLFQEPVVPIQTHKELLESELVTPAATSLNNTSTSSKSEAEEPSSQKVPSQEVTMDSEGPSTPSESDVVGIVAPIRFSTTELMKRNDVAQLLPQPLYVLFRHACAFCSIFGEEVRAEIQGDIQAAQVEARVLAAAQQQQQQQHQQVLQKSSKPTVNSLRSLINTDTNTDSPSLQQKDQMADDDENARKGRRGSDSHAENQYERFPLDVVVKIKKDALIGSHTIVHLRFGYLIRLGIVVVAVEAAPGILKFDPTLILQELFPGDYGEICPNPEAGFLGMTSYDTLISSNGATGEQKSDLVLDPKLAGGYAFRWAQEICGLEFLGPFTQGWGPISGSDPENLSAGDGSSSTEILSGTGNRRAFLSQVIRMIRNRRRAWKALERQLEDLEKGIITTPKSKASLELGIGMLVQPTDARNTISVSGWRAMEGSGSQKYTSLYSVQFLRADPRLSSRSTGVTAKVVVAEATVEIALAYVDRQPRWELRPGPGFPDSLKSSSSSNNGLGVRIDDSLDTPIDESMEGPSQVSTPKSEEDDSLKDKSPHLDALMVGG
ncbi:putative cell survival pathways protein [Haplosporangium sp. Z 27]|nr:putative cell survival pathways protein [Haplosporangium sp. Z 27]